MWTMVFVLIVFLCYSSADLLLPTPSWVSYAPQAHLLGRKVHRVAANPEDDYRLRVPNIAEALAVSRAINPDSAQMLLTNSPNNPTGCMFDAAEREQLTTYCRSEGVGILADEIYARVEHGTREHVSLAELYPEGTMVFGGLSKHLSLGGWRVGVGIVPDTPEGAELASALELVASELWSSNATPVQHAAILAYADSSPPGAIDAHVRRCAAMHALRTRALFDGLRALNVDVPEPHGGFYVFATFNRWREALAARNVHTSVDLAAYLLDEHAIASLPGSALGCAPNQLSLRLATSYLDCETDADAARIYASFGGDASSAEWLAERNQPQLHGAIRAFGDFVREMDK